MVLKLSLKQNDCKPSVIVALENDSDIDYLISRDSILLDGFTSNKFKVLDLDTGRELPYKGRFVKYHPEKILLSKHKILTNVLDLSEVYDLSHDLHYDIRYSTTLTPCKSDDACENPVKLSGDVNINFNCDF